MKIEIHTKKEDGSIKSVNSFNRDVEQTALDEMLVKYNANSDNKDIVEIREATPAETALLKELDDKRYIDRHYLNGLESDIENALDGIRNLQNLLEEKE